MAHNITAEEFDRLPKARTFQSLVTLSPSVNSGTLENGFQVNGASSAENQFNIDGISTNSIITGASRQDAVFEILEQVQVKTGGVDAEYGRHGRGDQRDHEIRRQCVPRGCITITPETRSAPDRSPRLLLNPIDDMTVSYRSAITSPAASPRFVRRENTYLADSGKTPVTIKQEQTFWQLFNKVTFAPATRVRGSAFWLWSPTKSKGSLPAYDYFGNAVTTGVAAFAPRPNIGYFAPQSNYGGNLDFTLTPTTLISVRGGRFWDNYKDTGIPEISSVTYQTPVAASSTLSQDLLNTIPANLRGGTGFYNTPGYKAASTTWAPARICSSTSARWRGWRGRTISSSGGACKRT